MVTFKTDHMNGIQLNNDEYLLDIKHMFAEPATRMDEDTLLEAKFLFEQSDCNCDENTSCFFCKLTCDCPDDQVCYLCENKFSDGEDSEE